MRLPFTGEQFLDIFRQYNSAIWPLQLPLALIALAIVVVAARGRDDRLVPLYLALQWAWTAVVYHWVFFIRINGAARVFGALWLAGGLLFAVNALSSRRLAFRVAGRPRLIVGGCLVAYGLVIYPILGQLGGHAYPFGPTYGAPCPVAIVTLGLLWLANPPIPRYVVIAPVVWAAIGSAAAFALGIYEDLGLLVAGLTGLVLLVQPAPRRVAQETAGR